MLAARSVRGLADLVAPTSSFLFQVFSARTSGMCHKGIVGHCIGLDSIHAWEEQILHVLVELPPFEPALGNFHAGFCG